MVAKLLQRAGLYLGPEDRLLGPDSANADGHFEHTGFLEINDALLQHFGGSWDAPPTMEPGWELDASLEDIRAKAETLVGSFSGVSIWGWKEPRTTILLPFWKSLINQPRFVICVRSPLDVAQSLASRNQMATDLGGYLWSRYIRSAIRDTEGYHRRLVFYDDFFTADGSQTRRLLKFCGLESVSGQTGLGNSIRGDLRHHRSEISGLLDDSSVPLHAKLLYLSLRALPAGESASKETEGESSDNIGRVLTLLDEFHHQGQLAELQSALSETKYELSRSRQETQIKLTAKESIISALESQLGELQRHADRLQTFSDAVRQTWAYRIYRRFIKPIRLN